MQQHAQTVFISPKTELTTSPTRCRDNATALHTTLGARGRNRFAPVLENEMSNGEGNSRKRQLFIKKTKGKIRNAMEFGFCLFRNLELSEPFQ